MSKNAPAVIGGKANLMALMQKSRDTIAMALPKHLNPDRMVKLALVAAARNPKIYECTQASVVQSIIQASQLGLDFTGTLGQGYLIPFKNNKTGCTEAQFIAGYRGLIELARRGGKVKDIVAQVVYACDDFEVRMGLENTIVHRPKMLATKKERDKTQIVAAYAVAYLADCPPHFEVMTLDEINGIRARSKAKDSGPWVTDFSEMARKTVVRRVIKYLPVSPELESLLRHEDSVDEFNMNGATAGADLIPMPEETEDIIEGEAKRIEADQDELPMDDAPTAEDLARADAE